jgi:hypothetical protein
MDAGLMLWTLGNRGGSRDALALRRSDGSRDTSSPQPPRKPKAFPRAPREEMEAGP